MKGLLMQVKKCWTTKLEEFMWEVGLLKYAARFAKTLKPKMLLRWKSRRYGHDWIWKLNTDASF